MPLQAQCLPFIGTKWRRERGRVRVEGERENKGEGGGEANTGPICYGWYENDWKGGHNKQRIDGNRGKRVATERRVQAGGISGGANVPATGCFFVSLELSDRPLKFTGFERSCKKKPVVKRFFKKSSERQKKFNTTILTCLCWYNKTDLCKLVNLALVRMASASIQDCRIETFGSALLDVFFFNSKEFKCFTIDTQLKHNNTVYKLRFSIH